MNWFIYREEFVNIISKKWGLDRDKHKYRIIGSLDFHSRVERKNLQQKLIC